MYHDPNTNRNKKRNGSWVGEKGGRNGWWGRGGEGDEEMEGVGGGEKEREGWKVGGRREEGMEGRGGGKAPSLMGK